MNVNYFKTLWKSSLMILMLCFGLTSVWGQTSIQNFGIGTGSYSSTTANTSFLPNPTLGTTYSRGGGGGTAPIVLATTSNPLETTDTYVRAVASSSTSVTKMSPVVGYTASTEFYTSFKVLFGSAIGEAGVTSGSWTFYQGSGSTYNNNSDFSGADVFTGLRFTYSNDVVNVTNRTSSWDNTGISITQGEVHTIEIIGNNSSNTINYIYNGINQTVASGKFDFYVDGILLGNDLTKGGRSLNATINSTTFIGISSTNNSANIFVDDVVIYNDIPESIGISTPTYTLTYTAGPNGTIEGVSPQTVDEGEDGTAVTAVPNTGYHFVSWSDDSTDNPRTDSDVQEDISVTANFAINTYTVTYDGNGSDGGSAPVDENSPYNHGSTVTVSNQGDLVREGHTFIGWTTVVNDVTSLVTTFEITSDVTLYAFWEDASKLDQTITFAELADVTYGDVFELSAFSDSGLDITYTSSNENVATINDNMVTIVGVGSTVITATQLGDDDYMAATPVEQTLIVNPKNLTISGVTVADKTYDSTTTADLDIETATLEGTLENDDVDFTVGTAEFASADAGSDIAVTATFSLTGTAAGNYTLTQPTLSGNILKADQTLSGFENITKHENEEAFDLPATTNEGLTLTYNSSDESVAIIDGNTVTIMGLGSTTITASQIGNENYNEFESTIILTVASQPIALARWDFTGENQLATSTADVINSNLNSGSAILTRGTGAAASSGNNSFRTTGFESNGINTSNTDYFQTSFTSTNGIVSFATIDASFVGTATFVASPGVTTQFAYSFDNIIYTLIPSSLKVTIGSTNMEQVNLSGVAALQNIPAGTTVYFRFYASGQTNTGGFGFSSVSSGSYGLQFHGNIDLPANLNTSVTSIENLNYEIGEGPSTEQSFQLSGVSLDSSDSVSISLSEESDFEISLLSDEEYTNSITLDNYNGTSTNIFVRLKADRIVGNYEDFITISGYDLEKEITLAGQVTPLSPTATPIISATGVENSTDNYWVSATITLTTETEGATIYYTINDGDIEQYTSPFSITSTSTIEAYASAADRDDSTIETKTITISQPATASLPYSEAFNNTLGDWTNQKLFGSGGFTGWTTSAQGVTVNGYNQGNTQAWLISPEFTVATGLLLSFDYASQFQGNNLQIKVSTNYLGYGNPGVATWTDVTSITENASNNLVSGSLTDYLISTSGTVHIALVYADHNNWAMWRINNLTVTSAIACDEGTLIAGTTEASATEILSGGSVNLSLTGTSIGTGLSYQWQSSSNGNDWTNIGGATNATYTATNITATTYFRAEVTCGATTVASSPVQINLTYCTAGATDTNDVYEKISNFNFLEINNSSNSSAGYENFTGISTDVSTTTHPFNVTISNVDADDQILIWIDLNQNAIFENNELVYEGDILDGSNDTVTGNITIPNTATLGSTRLRIRLHYSSLEGNSNPCGNSTYGQVEDYTVNILPDAIVWTTANEWSNVDGPTNTNDAIIEGDLTLTENLSAKTLTVAAGGKITVPANTALTVDGKITNNGEFTVESDGILYQNNYTGTNEGNITVMRAANPMKRLDYTLWSSPVSGMPLNQFSNISNNGGTGTIWNRVYELGADAWSSIWESYAEASTSTDTFVEAKGYLYRAFNSYDPVETTIFTGVFTGVPNNGDYTINTPYMFDAIGNPYPSPIDANDFITNNNADAIYFWTNVNSSNGTAYVYNNWASYTLLGGAGVTEGLEGETEYFTPEGTIQPGQGFVVFTEESSVSFDNSMRINSNGQFFRQMSNERHRFWLNLSNEEVVFNQILVGYMDNATQGVDTGIDGKMFAYEGNALYSIIENSDDNYVIQGRSLPFTTSDVVVLGFRAVNSGSFTISLNNFDGLFTDNQNIYLKDNFTQAVHNLKEGAYTFVSEEGVFNTRFEVVYQTTMSVENPVANNANWVVYSQEDGYQIQTQGFELQNVTVFDLLGRTIYTANAQGTVHQIPALGADSVYIVKVTTTDNVVLSKKVK